MKLFLAALICVTTVAANAETRAIGSSLIDSAPMSSVKLSQPVSSGASNISIKADAVRTESIQIESIGSYFDWGTARNGYGYCYEWTSNGQVLNQGQPVNNYNCEVRSPSYFSWGQGRDGYGYCYQLTPYGVYMNEGSAMSNWNCERTQPSYYTWGRGRDGYTYCYQVAPNGLYLNGGQAVSEYNCR